MNEQQRSSHLPSAWSDLVSGPHTPPLRQELVLTEGTWSQPRTRQVFSKHQTFHTTMQGISPRGQMVKLRLSSWQGHPHGKWQSREWA